MSQLTCFTHFREVSADGSGDVKSRARVILITEGAGNNVDKNFYPAETLRNSYQVFGAKKCFLNHPTLQDEALRPERDVREACGWFSDPEITMFGDKTAIVSDLFFSKNQAGREAKELIESALQFQQQFPDTGEVFVGFSISASGSSHEDMIGGESWNIVDSIDDAFSVDLVTFPARGGKAIQLQESLKFRDLLRHAVVSEKFRQDFIRSLGTMEVSG